MSKQQAGEMKELEALIIGVGVSGIYQLHCLLERGIDAAVF